MTKQYEDASSTTSDAVTAALADQALTNGGATGPRTATSGAAADAVAQSIAIDSAHSGASIGLRGVSHAHSTTTALTLTPPPGTDKETLRFAQVAIRGDATATVTPPSGWTLLLSTASNNSVRSLLFGTATAPATAATWTLSAARQTAGGMVAYSAASQFTTKVVSVRYWRSAGSPPTTFLAAGASCPSPDNGLQLVSLHVNSADNRAAQDVDVVKRKP
jgi:hypothetical protein